MLGSAIKTAGLPLVNMFPEIVRFAPPERDLAVAAASNINLQKQFFMVAGSWVIPSNPRQPKKDLFEIFRSADECHDEYVRIMKDYARKSGAVKMEVVPDKTMARTYAKARDDYDGDLSRVCDIKRGSIYIDSLQQYKKICNLLLPINNSAVVRIQDGMARPDEAGALRRIKINIEMSTNGHVAEIQVRHVGMEKAYEKSEPIYKDMRALRAKLESLDKENSDDENVQVARAAVEKKLRHKETKRCTIHENAARRTKLDGVIVDRTLYFVDTFPVIHAFDRATKEHSAIVPDIHSGLFVTDNKFLPLLSDPARKVNQVQREPFIARCHALVSNVEAKACLKLA